MLVPFGIPGAIAFLLFGLASLRVLHRNFRHGDAPLRTANAFLYACFAAKFIFFWTVFGALASDLAHFCGFVALSVALNGGVRSAGAPAPSTEVNREARAPVAA